MRDTRDPFHRAFFLFEEHAPYDPDRVVAYNNKAGNAFFNRPPRLA
jgi:hypothetical protein